MRPHSLRDYGLQGLGGKYAGRVTLAALSDCGLTASKRGLAEEEEGSPCRISEEDFKYFLNKKV